MAKTDLDVIKEIPGYKVILKAVVKSQIQQLVEQLAAHTDEESVILTASVSDGTLSHIGSASGKSFLQDHEDFKSQFLGFCLKDQHRRKMEKERLEREKIEQELLQQQQQQQQQQMMYLPPGPRFTKSPSQYAARYQSPRHQPYSVPRPRRPPGVAQVSMSKVVETVVKAERVDSDDASNQSGMDNQGLKTSANLSDSGADNDCQGADSDTSNIVGNDSLNAEQGGSNERHNSEDIVKLEPLTESELDLEITGVEPGQSTQGGEESKWDPNSSQGGEDWDPSVSIDMGYNLGGATGSAEDMTGQQGYNGSKWMGTEGRVEGQLDEGELFFPKYNLADLSVDDESATSDVSDSLAMGEFGPLDISASLAIFPCELCGKILRHKRSLNRHMLSHSTDGYQYRFACQYCGLGFKIHNDFVRHLLIHTGEKPFECEVCGKKFNRKSNLKLHFRQHLPK